MSHLNAPGTRPCGPGSIDQAHQPNEFIEIAQVAACAALLRKLRDWAAGG